MKRRGLRLLPDDVRRRGLPARLGGPGPAHDEVSRLAGSQQAQESQMDIWEDVVDEEEVTAVCEDDVDPPERTDRAPLGGVAINLLGVNYGPHYEFENDSDNGEDWESDENTKHHVLGETIGGQILDLDETPAGPSAESPEVECIEGSFLQGGGTQVDISPETAANASSSTSDLPNNLKHGLATDPNIEEESPEIIADGQSTRDLIVDDFHLSMMLFVTAADLSRTQYEALTEAFSLATIESLMTLPKSIKTLKERCRRSFPLLNIKAKPVDISLNVTPPKSESPRWAYYFNSSDYCRLWLSNPKLNTLIYKGFGKIVDTPTELWHGDAWMESVRSTSGSFARINEHTSDALDAIPKPVILLPSDCVKFIDSSGAMAFGKVKAIGLDRRSSTTGITKNGVVSAIISPLVPREQLSADLESVLAQSAPLNPGDINGFPPYPSVLPELVLLEIRLVVPCSAITSRIWVYFTDYETPESLTTSLLPHSPSFCVRQVIYCKERKLYARSICKRHRVTAEAELINLTRQVVLSSFVPDNSPPQDVARISLPFSVFLDGFGLYRNAYHSLKGMYITPAGLDVDSRTQLQNMFVLMIGPFGTHELNMAACLETDGIAMGAGKELTLESGKRVFVTAFPLLFTGDMPQQNQNSGNKSHNAEFGCRSCFVPDLQRGDLHLDIFANGRYRAPIQRIFDYAAGLRTKTARAVIHQKYGLTPEGPYFTKCYPMMDPQRANPNDPFHAELRLCKYYSEALLEGILSPAGIIAYREAWNVVEVPYGWGQPQNPVNHKGSMVFSEHGRMAIMNPFVLMRLFSKENWGRNSANPGKVFLKAGVKERLKTAFGGGGVPEREPRLQVLRTAFMLSKTVHLVLKRSLSQEDRAQFAIIVIEMRTLLRKFFHSTIATKGGHQKYADVPNIHLGLHYEMDIENFASTYNSTTMIGEQKHKVFKQHATHTNSQENDLQLLKATNTSQTLRFLLDGTFSESHSRISKQLNEVVDKCPILKERFLGCRDSTNLKPEDSAEEDRCFGIDVSGSLLYDSKTGCPLALKCIEATNKQSDLLALQDIYREEYNVNLDFGLRFKIHYWGYFAGKPRTKSREFDGQHRFRIRVNSFVRLRGDGRAPSLSFYKVRRIFTVTVGTMVRVFFVLGVLERDTSQEMEAAPYPVFRCSFQSTCIVVGIRKLDPTIFHFISKGVDSWWFNPFVPYFL